MQTTANKIKVILKIETTTTATGLKASGVSVWRLAAAHARAHAHSLERLLRLAETVDRADGRRAAAAAIERHQVRVVLGGGAQARHPVLSLLGVPRYVRRHKTSTCATSTWCQHCHFPATYTRYRTPQRMYKLSHSTARRKKSHL